MQSSALLSQYAADDQQQMTKAGKSNVADDKIKIQNDHNRCEISADYI